MDDNRVDYFKEGSNVGCGCCSTLDVIVKLMLMGGMRGLVCGYVRCEMILLSQSKLSQKYIAIYGVQ